LARAIALALGAELQIRVTMDESAGGGGFLVRLRGDVAPLMGARIAELVAQGRPDDYTTEWSRAKRRGRIFLDYARHGYAQTAVAPYGVRARPGAPVATPIDWEELAGMAPDAYTLRSIGRRLAQKADPWRDIEGARGSIATARLALDEIERITTLAPHLGSVRTQPTVSALSPLAQTKDPKVRLR
jgi:hypothetical protein